MRKSIRVFEELLQLASLLHVTPSSNPSIPEAPGEVPLFLAVTSPASVHPAREVFDEIPVC
jgi:hypothetical protein